MAIVDGTVYFLRYWDAQAVDPRSGAIGATVHQGPSDLDVARREGQRLLAEGVAGPVEIVPQFPPADASGHSKGRRSFPTLGAPIETIL